MRNFRKTFNILIITLLLSSCKEPENSCSNFTIVNDNIILKIEKYNLKSDNWNLENIRMMRMKEIITEIHDSFILLNTSLKDKSDHNDSKNKIVLKIEHFIDKTSYENWNNKEYIWILEDAKSELKNINFAEENCIEMNLNKSLTIEENLISTLYLLGYSDNYCFNKMEPIVKSYNINDMKDTISFTIGHYAYDSTQCNTVSYEISNLNGVIKDSTDCNWFEVQRVQGLNKFNGMFYYDMFGKTNEIKFYQEVIIN